MDLQEILEEELAEEFDDGPPLQELVGAVVGLAEPLQDNFVAGQNVVPRNLNYFEETIPQYMGELFVDHFRMTRPCFEVRGL